MSFFDTLRRKFIGSRAFQGILWGNYSTSYTRWNKRQLVEQGYGRNPVFSAICERIAELVADLPVYVEAEARDGRATHSDRHPLLDAMDRSDQGFHSIIKRTTLYLVVTGEAYIQKLFFENDGRKSLVGFVVLPADFTNPIQGNPMQPVIGYEYIQNGRVVFDKDEVIYISNPSIVDYLHGNSPGVSLGEIIDMQNAGITWNKNVAIAGGLPSLVVKAPGITPEESNQLKDDWAKTNGGASNAHKIKVAGGPGEMEILNLNFRPNDAEWAKGIELATRLIAMRMGYPSELLNDPSGKTYANVHEATRTLYRDVIIPTANRVYGAINRGCSQYYKDRPKIIVDEDKVEALGEDRKMAVERLSLAVERGILTPNEAREELGYPMSDEESANVLRNKQPQSSVGITQQI